MKTKILTFMLSLLIGGVFVNKAEAQYYRRGYCRPYRPCGIIITPRPILAPGIGYYGPYKPRPLWIDGYWRYNRRGASFWVPGHWR